ncbi:hypothetical protein B0H16DRAFT_1712909 [Mycena metata]|uniref:DUF6987 domain-containing protein n=1 Tax=Mycena metata TaxID=1033252 RepID=A0AAD7NU61_9AGAR|nr:hypothetical protein B0H16DRAFT_1712909 [Mycena metata]
MSELDFNDNAAHQGKDERNEQEKETDRNLADRLSALIEDANAKCQPLCKMIRKHIENMEARKEEDRDEAELVKNVKPLLEQVEKILNETNGAIRGADPDNRLSNKATRNRTTRPRRKNSALRRLLKSYMIQDVGGTIDWAKDKLESFPKAKKDLGPLLDALSQPLTQIVGGVVLLLTGVLNLVGRLLSGLGLDGLLKGIVAATGLDKIYRGLGLDKWLAGGK